MDSLTLGMLSLFVLIILTLLEIPIGLCMAMIGLCGGFYLAGIDRTLDFLGMYVYSNVANFTLSAVPIFLLMGEFVSESGASRELYNTANKWLGRMPAGLSAVTIASCAVFSACCGSSAATAGTLGTIAIPEMRRHGYSPRIVAGSLAAGGTLGNLIPPGIVPILYGIFAEQSVGKIFIACILPGILMTLLFIGTVVVWATVYSSVAPPSDRAYTRREKIDSLPGVAGILVLFLLVLGGIYVGWFTPTEAAAIGAFGAFIIMLARGKMTKKALLGCVMNTVRTTGMIYFILIGAMFFQFFMAQTQLPALLVEVLNTHNVGPYGVLGLVLIILIVLGFAFDEIAMLILVTPIVVPVLEANGIDLIWFGVLLTITIEMAFISPPVGLVLYVIRTVAPEISTADLYAGVFPVIAAQCICLIILILWPQISLFLPALM